MTRSRAVGGRWPWVCGVLAGVAVVGPGLRPGGLLSLDLIATPTIPVPSGIWGLGPDLPRRVPYGVVLAWLSHVVGGPLTIKLVLIACIASAFAGVAHLMRDHPPLVRVGAGLLYALSPFTLTRVGAGHVGVLLGMAVLPWALPWLVHPATQRPRVLLWATAMALTGFGGGVLALLLLAVGLVADRGRRLGSTLGVAVVSQLPWVVPAVVVTANSAHVEPASGFATRLGGAGGVLQLATGHGFWRASSQVGATGAGTALLGCTLVVLAVMGARRLPVGWGRRATGGAVLGFALAAASGVPGIEAVYRWLTSAGPGLVLRESQRALPLFLVWLAPAAALGAHELARQVNGRRALVYLAVPGVVAMVLAAPGLWGVGGRLEPVRFPDGWKRVGAEIQRHPGTVLALPWHQYLDVGFAGGRRVLNPLPDYLGGDVIVSSDPELGAPGQERADRREPLVAPVIADMRAGRKTSDTLTRIGVRWIALIHEVDWTEYRALDADPGLVATLKTASVDLYEVRDWSARTAPRPDGKGWPTVIVALADAVTAAACVRAAGSCGVTQRNVPSLSAVKRR